MAKVETTIMLAPGALKALKDEAARHHTDKGYVVATLLRILHHVRNADKNPERVELFNEMYVAAMNDIHDTGWVGGELTP